MNPGFFDIFFSSSFILHTNIGFVLQLSIDIKFSK